ncbi:MAG: hypothetical protein AB7I42_25680 [Bradyrhizobium sp.]|uniref:hypothetical protein n=1 Tax=Bradyrhizobium sp. TaxID=376 RepID=UPI003D0D34AE
MMTLLSRLAFFLASFSLTLGSSIASMQGGFDISLGDMLAKVPALCWLFAFGAGCIGAIDSKVITKNEAKS